MANLDLSKYGIVGDFEVVHNPSYEVLFQDEMNPANEGFEKAKLTNTGATAVFTGKFTGRSPKDKFIVKDSITEDTLWWDGTINRPTTPEVFDHCKNLVTKQLSTAKKLYVVDTFCGTNEDTRMKVRFIMEVAWQ
ncbi:MAG: phosphoenolpyruvate carboxykinase (ATP), partial [Bacteroidales bacterium]|nr:phosphoenolpyruvate carboxykinase (ATP) [Bacteroidales bacterium]